MSLIHLRDITIGFGGPPLLERINLRIDAGERVCLVGRNGCGKSTLLNIMAGQVQAEDGLIERQQGLKAAILEQEIAPRNDETVFDLVAEGLGEIGGLLQRYQQVSANLRDAKDLGQLDQLQHQLDQSGAWQFHSKVESVISRLQLPATATFANLSGGQQRRVLLGRALVREPDLLLLDEPTNHLDIASIEWLEEFLPTLGGALVFVTHDRVFLRALATRIVEIDRGRLFDWPGDYADFLRRREVALAEEAEEQRKFDKRLAEEERWIRQGIKARRTRNEGRARSLQKMREQRRARRDQAGVANLRMGKADKSGTLVLEARKVSYAWGDKPIVKDFTTTIWRGDRVGLVGPNGCGKSTLLKLLLGELPPDSGQIHQGTRLAPIYFDQLRARLEPEKSVLDNVGEGQTHIAIGDSRKHVLGYLQDFLFTPQRARTPVAALSGGERNRVLLAKLFTRPGNLLVMDEPTNDLDVETLELLEELLVDYRGTLLLVSHDRAFLNNLVTSTLVFEGGGTINEYVGGYDDWLRQRRLPSAKEPGRKEQADGAAAGPKPVVGTGKLNYQQQRELQFLPVEIERLEGLQEGLHARMAEPGFYRQEGAAIARLQQELAGVAEQLARHYQRWEELERLTGR